MVGQNPNKWWALGIALLAGACTGQLGASGDGSTGNAATGAPGSDGSGSDGSGSDGSGPDGSGGGSGGSGPGTPAGGESVLRPKPSDGTAERALSCEADHAPLRRLNHREYQNTVRDLFAPYGDIQVSVAPDARREGFTNNYQAQTPTLLSVTEYAENAATVAERMAGSVVSVAKCGGDAACFERIVDDLVSRAYRRPLESDEAQAYSQLYSGTAAGDIDVAVEQLIKVVLQSPAFLYRPEFGGADGTLDPYEVASRLSYFLWATMPDNTLLDAASRDALSGNDLRSQVERMVGDPRARNGLLSGVAEWFELERLDDALKADSYNFTAEVQHDLVESFERFIWDRVLGEDVPIETLFTSPGAYVNARIGPLFGVNDAGDEWEWREVPNRSGALTHPAILAIHGYGDYPSPVRRGVFILTEVLCDPPAPPPAGVSMGEPSETDDTGKPLTNRDGYRELTQSQQLCASCHDSINPFGFAFENYDTVGAYRTTDNGSPVDATGQSRGFSLRESFAFDDAIDLSQQFADSSRVRACVVDRWLRYATGGGPLAYDPCLRSELETMAQEPGVSLQDIIIAIAIHPSFAAAEVVP